MNLIGLGNKKGIMNKRDFPRRGNRLKRHLKKSFNKFSLKYKTARIVPKLTPDAFRSLKELKRNGIAQYPYNLQSLCERFVETRKKSPHLFQRLDNLHRQKVTGCSDFSYASFSNSILREIFFGTEIIDIIARYYRRQPYFRRLPFIKTHFSTEQTERDISSVFHTDQCINQVAVQILLNDLTISDYHMSYLQKSHKKYVSSYIRPSLRAVCLEENEKRIGLKYKTFHVIGKKGDVFIFDNGNGLHRGEVVKGSTRSILQASFHMGDYVYKDTDRDFLECTYEKSSLRKICKKSLQYLY